jgi:hypothetical protein
MSVGTGFSYTLSYEDPRFTRRARTSASTRRPTAPGRISGRRGRRVPRRLNPNRLALARLVPCRGFKGADCSSRTGPAPQVDQHTREDHPAVVAPQPHGTGIRHRVVERTAVGPIDRTRVRYPVQSALPERLAPRPGVHPQKPQRVPRERVPTKIEAWLATDWPRIQKKHGDKTPRSP